MRQFAITIFLLSILKNAISHRDDLYRSRARGAHTHEYILRIKRRRREASHEYLKKDERGAWDEGIIPASEIGPFAFIRIWHLYERRIFV